MKSAIILLVAFGVCNGLSLKRQANCGVPVIKPDTSANLAGGKDAIPYSWPWQVAIFSNINNTQKFVSGATLISKQWLMTAAGAVWNKSSDFVVKLGVFNKDKNDEAGELVLKIAEMRFHYNYSEYDLLSPFDIALMKLEKPVEFTDHILPICLPKSKTEPLPKDNTPVIMTGWGHDGPTINNTVTTLKQLTLPIVAGCNESYPAILNNETHFCTGIDDEKVEKETCYGDAGGPVMIQEGEAWKQIGIITRIGACSGLPTVKLGIKSKVAPFLDFITSYVKDL